MNENKKDCECLELVAQVLGRCFLGGVILLLVWWLAFANATDWLYGVNTRWFAVSREQFVLVNYYGIAAAKIFVYLVFLIPYVCVRLVIRKNR